MLIDTTDLFPKGRKCVNIKPLKIIKPFPLHIHLLKIIADKDKKLALIQVIKT